MYTPNHHSFSTRHFAIAAIGIFLGSISSEAFTPQSSMARLHPVQELRGISRVRDSRPSLYPRSPDDIKVALPLYAMTPDYSSVGNYIYSATQPEVVAYSTAWTLCLVMSVFYAISIIRSDGGKPCSNDGFCISGYCGEEYVDGDVIVTNSHTLSWNVDVVFAAVAISLPIIDKFTAIEIPNIGRYAFEPTLDIMIATPVLILAHGLLHKGLAKDFVPPNNKIMPEDEKKEGDPLGFALFSAILVAVTVIGFSSVPEAVNGSIPALGGIVAVITAFIYWLTLQANKKEMGISAYFMSTQVLVSAVGSLAPNNMADPLMGWTYAVTCAVSLVEYFGCKNIFRPIGGHMWYDVALHTSLLTGFWLLSSPLEQATRVLSL
jgi:hypothetical protein